MDRPLFHSCFGWPLSTVAITIGTIQSVIFTGLFLLEYAYSVLRMIEYDIPVRHIIEDMTLAEMTNGAAVLCCVVNITLIYGVKKSRPGFILAWLLQQLVWIASSLVTIFYYLVVVWLKLPLEEALIGLLITGFQLLGFLFVYSHYVKLRSGNLQEEP